MRRCGTMPTMLMYPQIDPVALQIGPLAVHWYGLTYLAAFGLFLWLGTRRLRHPPFVRMQGDRAWTRKDVDAYLDRFELPYHPLYAYGYRSIGDHHSTFPTSDGQDEREGRRLGEKAECGIHLPRSDDENASRGSSGL